MKTIEGMLDAPCIFCGYNGAGYFQRGTHGALCPWYSVGGMEERVEALPAIIKILHNNGKITHES